ncbi:hypothetical protein U91I_03502 [alpha proteobacterium U9-1i]|nr:hypothetical protein U91I_03502 [alpha proteobacterium U9-1i]
MRSRTGHKWITRRSDAAIDCIGKITSGRKTLISDDPNCLRRLSIDECVFDLFNDIEAL